MEGPIKLAILVIQYNYIGINYNRVQYNSTREHKESAKVQW